MEQGAGETERSKGKTKGRRVTQAAETAKIIIHAPTVM